MAKVSVIGAGSWGIALAKVLDTNGHAVTVWSILEDEIAQLSQKREHTAKLPGVLLSERIQFTADLKEAVQKKDLLVLAVPSVYTRSTARSMAPFVACGQRIVTVAKGIEEGTLKTQTEIVEEEIPKAEVAVLSGCW